jgi:hypothetical protein
MGRKTDKQRDRQIHRKDREIDTKTDRHIDKIKDGQTRWMSRKTDR